MDRHEKCLEYLRVLNFPKKVQQFFKQIIELIKERPDEKDPEQTRRFYDFTTFLVYFGETTSVRQITLPDGTKKRIPSPPTCNSYNSNSLFWFVHVLILYYHDIYTDDSISKQDILKSLELLIKKEPLIEKGYFGPGMIRMSDLGIN